MINSDPKPRFESFWLVFFLFVFFTPSFIIKQNKYAFVKVEPPSVGPQIELKFVNFSQKSLVTFLLLVIFLFLPSGESSLDLRKLKKSLGLFYKTTLKMKNKIWIYYYWYAQIKIHTYDDGLPTCWIWSMLHGQTLWLSYWSLSPK